MPRPPLEPGTFGEITVRKTPSGSHLASARYRDADCVTRRVTATGKTSAEAKRRLRNKLVDRPVYTAQMPFATLVDAWEKHLETYDETRRQSLANYKRVMRNHIVPRIGNRPIWTLNAGVVEDMLNEIYADSPGNYGNAFTVMSDVSRFILRRGLGVDLMAGSKRRKEVRKKAVRSLTADELVRLRGNVRRWQERPITNQPLLDVVDVLMSTGARIGEVLALRWEDVDFAKNTVHISATQVFIKGEGIVYQPISKGSKDLLYPLTPTAVQTLRRRLRQRNGEWVFGSRGGETMISRANLNRAWRVARGDDFAWVSWKVFRQSVATIVKNADSLDAASKLLGHSGVSITKKHYVESTPELVPDVTAVLEMFSTNKRLTDG